jgi:hypothetical protein
MRSANMARPCATVPPVPSKLRKMNVRMPFDLGIERVPIEPAPIKS